MKRGETGGGETAVPANDGAIPSNHLQGGGEVTPGFTSCKVGFGLLNI